MPKLSLMQKYSRIKFFLGKEVIRYCYISIFSGFFLFCVESSFIFVIQGFLLNLKVIAPEATNLPSWYPQSLRATLLFLILFGFLRMLAFTLKTFILNAVGEIFKCYQRSYITRNALEFSEELSTVEVINLFSQATNRAGESLSGILNSTSAFIAASCFFILGLKVAPLEMITGLLALGVLSFPLRWLDGIFKRVGAQITEHWENLTETIVNGIRHSFYLKVYGKVRNEVEKCERLLLDYEKQVKTYHWANAIKVSTPLFFGIIIVAGISLIGVKAFNTSGPRLVAFFYIFIRFAQTLSEILAGPINIRLNLSSIKELYSFQTEMEEKAQERRARPTTVLDTAEMALVENTLQHSDIDIVLDDIAFKYSSDNSQDYLFKELTLKIKKGDCLVIKGPSGAGKSTLLSLILGINKPSLGKINLNQWAIETIRGQLFNHVAYVGSDPFQIPGTILENLMYGHPKFSEVTKDEIHCALKVARIYDFVMSLPAKENTFLNESAKISSGQKQRLSIARAILRRPKILVLDECTSNLDVQNELEIINSLSVLKPGLVTIVVTHRPAFTSIATQIIDLPQVRQ
jgi:ATP-binding cassette, subfamily C, bacterial